jgi:uncharacterized phage protein gp47/JayE
MPLIIPSRQAVVQTLRAYLLSAVPEWDTSTLRRSWVGGMVTSLGSGLHDWYVALKQASIQFFPQTAQGDFLTEGWWTNITKLSQNPAAAATGVVALTGTNGAPVLGGTILSANSLSYVTQHGVSIVQQSLRAISLTNVGGVCTFTTLEPHNLATGMTMVISGATPSDYNGSVEIIVTDDDDFIFDIPSGNAGASSPATGGSILATASWANVPVTCSTTGDAGNLDGGATLSVGVSGVSAAIVTFDGVGGGSASEDPEAFRARILFALGQDVGAFTQDEIQTVAESVPGVTRVWVRSAQVNPPSGWPLEGQVFVAFMRDNDANPFPTAQEVNTVSQAIISQCMTANTAPEDVVVSSPTPQPVNFTFTNITPDTPTMRQAINANLAQFFLEGVNYGVNVLQDDYRCAIRDTYDPNTRTRLTSFTLSGPSGDISVAAANLPTLGTVLFP